MLKLECVKCSTYLSVVSEQRIELVITNVLLAPLLQSCQATSIVLTQSFAAFLVCPALCRPNTSLLLRFHYNGIFRLLFNQPNYAIHDSSKVNAVTKYSSLRTCLTAMGTNMSYGITRC